MRIQRIFILIALLSVVSGCYFGITGKVIDAETNQPIEGAIVLVEWTKTHGLGLTYTESYKVAETLSDKDGKFDLPGCYSPFVNPPNITAYKKGYVAWSSRWIFPSWKNRDDFQWRSGNMYKLEKFKDAYSYPNHQMFVSGSINDTIGWESKKIFIKTYEAAERTKAIKEQNEKDSKRMRGNHP